MGLLTTELQVRVGLQTDKYYESLGYVIPKFKDNRGRYVSEKSISFITVRVEHLKNKSANIVEVVCDECGVHLDIPYYNYTSCVKEDGRYFCQSCAVKNISDKIYETKLKESISIYDFCNSINRMDIINRWDYDKNIKSPQNISFKTNKKIYLKCPNGIHQSSKYYINNLFRNNISNFDCGECNSIGQYFINNSLDINSIWSDKNADSVMDILLQSNKKYWFKCENNIHDDFYRSPSASFRYKYHCPNCSQDLKNSYLQTKVQSYLNDVGYKTNHEKYCSILLVNPKTKRNLPYDNEVIDLKLIIEVHGEQHYKIIGFTKHHAKRNNTTSEIEFRKRQVYDRYKRMYAKYKGYHYLEIPYWTDDAQETWKKLIDDKIKDIKGTGE